MPEEHIRKMKQIERGNVMRRIKKVNGWGIYQNNDREVSKYGFGITVLTPDDVEYSYMCSPANSDMEFNDVKAAEHWIRNHGK